jgi:crotonobetainyl-CoA:carnitine CoA-transferase CaiB-like acyl-CoA transferase
MLLDIPLDGRAVKVPGNPIKLSAVPDLPAEPPPSLGQHTNVLRNKTARRRA